MLFKSGGDVSARLHVIEKESESIGFASITTIGIMFGQNLHPDLGPGIQRSGAHHSGDRRAGGDADYGLPRASTAEPLTPTRLTFRQ